MLGWYGISKDRKFALQIDAVFLSEMYQHCNQAGSLETGGILIGCYSKDLTLAKVTGVTGPPKDSKASWFSFQRGFAGLKEFLKQKWYSKIRSHYIGEWHYHPCIEVVPSPDDFGQMIQISQNPSYDCKEPLMVILGMPNAQGMRRMRCFVTVESRTLELFED